MEQTAREAIREALSACVRCGACMQVCPVYRAGRREKLVARGKLRLLEGLEGGPLTASRELAQTLGRCLLCGRCSANCPNQVPAMEALRAGRELVARAVGLPLLKRLILDQALPHPRRLDLLARAAGLAQPLTGGALPLASGLNLRLAGLEMAASLPPLATRPFLADAPREVAGPSGAPRLGLFVGCVANYLRPGLAQRAVRLLSQVATVVIPPQGCCGLPAVGAGLSDTAAGLAASFVESFGRARVDKIVTACGSCAYSLAKEAPRLLDTPEARRLAGSVLEISQVLAEHPRLLARLGGDRRPVAVHDPCHLKVGLKVSEEPRAMLKAAGVDLVEMAGADQCCGGGGLFSVNQPELSQQILEPRKQALALSGARVLATSCSGCHLQWLWGLEGAAQVVHPLELLNGP